MRVPPLERRKGLCDRGGRQGGCSTTFRNNEKRFFGITSGRGLVSASLACGIATSVGSFPLKRRISPGKKMAAHESVNSLSRISGPSILSCRRRGTHAAANWMRESSNDQAVDGRRSARCDDDDDPGHSGGQQCGLCVRSVRRRRDGGDAICPVG